MHTQLLKDWIEAKKKLFDQSPYFVFRGQIHVSFQYRIRYMIGTDVDFLPDSRAPLIRLAS